VKIVFTIVGYIKLDHLCKLCLQQWDTKNWIISANCVYNSGIHKFGSFVQIQFTTVGYIKLDHLCKLCLQQGDI